MDAGSRRGSVAGVVSDESRSAIAASALSKLVFKNGRITIAPEVMLKASGLLPPRPTESTSDIHDKLAGAQIKANIAEVAQNRITPVKAMQTVDEIESSDSEGSQASRRSSVDESMFEWTWDRIECERKRGLKVANALATQSVLENELNDSEALGRHTDGSGIAGVVLTLAQLGKMSNYQFL